MQAALVHVRGRAARVVVLKEVVEPDPATVLCDQAHDDLWRTTEANRFADKMMLTPSVVEHPLLNGALG